jgi:DhnA family fructose-bisphosphate aldolase class Ia
LRAKVLAPLKEISRDDLIRAIAERAMQTAKAAKETGEAVIKANMPGRRPRWKKFVRNHPAIVTVTSLMTIIKIYRARKRRT